MIGKFGISIVRSRPAPHFDGFGGIYLGSDWEDGLDRNGIGRQGAVDR